VDIRRGGRLASFPITSDSGAGADGCVIVMTGGGGSVLTGRTQAQKRAPGVQVADSCRRDVVPFGMPRWSRRLALALGALSAAAAASLQVTTAGPSALADARCPKGTVLADRTQGEVTRAVGQADKGFGALVRAADSAARTHCKPLQAPERFGDLAAMAAERNTLSAGPLGYTPPGALRAALTQQSALAATSVPGSDGSFSKVGTTPLITDGPESPQVNGLGLADQAGRVDSYAYDAVHRRVFSAPGTGGVWMTANLGKRWTSVGDALPYQSVGAVTWSRQGNPAVGTLLVVSGEASGGGSVYTGLGGFYSTDLGKTWKQSKGIPDGLMGFEIEVDPLHQNLVYAATSQGLYRSTDTGRTYVNVKLPTGSCAGRTGYDNICQNANWVTDVEIQAPGGTSRVKGGRVLAVVGYRAGRLPYPGTSTPQSPANGIYRSETGAPGTFSVLDVSGDGTTPVGFAPQERIGRTELGAAIGAGQDHNYVYAIVEDAVLFNGGVPGIDVADDSAITGGVPNNTTLNGIYVSSDWGSSWTRMADELELQSPVTESALIGTSQTAGLYAPGVQSWYNQWIAPDPTRHTEAGVPTRLVFGLEELWESRLENTPQDGATQSVEPASFRVIGPYFSGSTCAFVDNPLPVCLTQQTQNGDLTTHPDQQSGIWIPGANGSVTLLVGNDGGSYSQTVAGGAPLTKKWGRGSQNGYNTLLPYDASAATDGTVVYGLQDNGSGHITPAGKIVGTYGGDGFFAAVDPDNSKVYYNETTLASMQVTTDGGKTYSDISPSVSNPQFSNSFVMDPTDAHHLLTAGPEVVERTQGPNGSWVQVYTLSDTMQMTAVELQGAAAYVGWCSVCDLINKTPDKKFFSGIATNVGGSKPPAKGKPDGWHQAPAKGLPDRYISGIAVDPKNPKTVYVALAGYANRQWWPVGSFNDKNPNVGEGHVFKSTDGGASFHDITGSLPDVPARSIEVRGGQLLVGTDLGLFLSRDTKGSAWAALKGLPHVPVVSVKNWPGRTNEVVLATFGRGVYRYTFGSGSVVPPVIVKPPTDNGNGGLAATGLPVGLAGFALVLVAGGVLLRRRLR
jgi:hypothetical protein